MTEKIDPRQDLAKHTLISKYARYLPEQRRRETYDEAVQRMFTMHRRHLAKRGTFDPKTQIELDRAERAVLDQRVLGSQRALQFGGDAIHRINVRGYNCSYSFFDRPRFLAEAVWVLLAGCGVGFSVQKHHVAKLPLLCKPSNFREEHIVQDSIEGWADAFDVLFRSYVGGLSVRFDYSQVRPAGSSISTSSAKAPGPKPLRDSIESVRGVLDAVVARGGVIRPIDAYDMVMHAASCVRAGGIRRSATIALFSPDDEEMTNAKTGDWYKTNPQRRLSNNSALLVRSTATREQFDRLIKATEQFGEPGFFFSDSPELGTNPCGEITLDPVDHETGETAWAFCNLSTVNVAACPTPADFYDACIQAATIGTVQATYTDVGYLTPATKRVLERDALLGVSLTGMADNPTIAFDPVVLRCGAWEVVETNRILAERLGIRPAARCTTVKPEGTGSLLLGVGNGIHPHHARRYLRYVEGGRKDDPLVRFIASVNPEAVVQSAYAEDEVKLVFPIDLGEGPQWLKADTDPIDHLEKVRMVQAQWVAPGGSVGCHNVSNTVQVPAGRWQDVADHIWRHRDEYAGVSLLSASGDLDYQQAPFVEVLTPVEALYKYGTSPHFDKALDIAENWARLKAAWQSIDFSQFREDEDRSAGVEVVACAGGACSF